MSKEILRKLPDGNFDYDGEEDLEEYEEDEYQRSWEDDTYKW